VSIAALKSPLCDAHRQAKPLRQLQGFLFHTGELGSLATMAGSTSADPSSVLLSSANRLSYYLITGDRARRQRQVATGINSYHLSNLDQTAADLLLIMARERGGL
jgi:hypothetical protein